MNRTIELPSGKIIDLNRFVALVPDEKAENQEYHLILEGCEKAMQRGLGGFPAAPNGADRRLTTTGTHSRPQRLHQEAIALNS